MASRKPLVLIGGSPTEIPAGDTLTVVGAGADSEIYGKNAEAVGARSLAIGANAKVGAGGTGVESIAIGSGDDASLPGPIADGNKSVVIGNQGNDNGNGGATLVGHAALAQDPTGGGAQARWATALGSQASAGEKGVAVGYYATAADGAVAILANDGAGAGYIPAGTCQIGDRGAQGAVGIGTLRVAGPNRDTIKAVENPGGSNKVGLFVTVDNGAVVVRQVEIGAADSGGSGYRILRVAN
jgi:hypothetical protein